MATDKQFEANRENSKLSTGPNTPEGKAISSRNAIVHGWCCKVHILESEREEFEDRVGDWVVELAIDGSRVKRELVILAVQHYHRANRGLKADAAEAARRVRDSGAIWDREQAMRLKADLEEFKENAPVAVKSLESTVAGCDWMMKTWEGLFHCMDKQLWKPPYHEKSRKLLGYDTTDPDRDIRLPDIWQFVMQNYMDLLVLEGQPIVGTTWQEQILTVAGLIAATNHDHKILWERKEKADPACASYESLMQEEIARLREIKMRLIPIELADREGAKERALVDGSPEGRLILRYIGEAQRDMYRALKEIRVIGDFADKTADRLARNEANLRKPDSPKHV